MNYLTKKTSTQEFEAWVKAERGDKYHDMLTYDIVALGGEVGEIQDAWKKAARGSLSTNELVEDILLESGDVLHYLVRLLQDVGYSLQDAMDANVEKLENRKKYGKGKHGKRS